MTGLHEGRLAVPEVLDGPWDHAVVCTFNTNLAFYEHTLARKLGTARNRVLIVDHRMLVEAFEEVAASGEATQVNGSYLVTPMRAPGAAHAKFILLASQQRGRLLVGSGNLTQSGYTGYGEQFTRYDHTEELAFRHWPAFAAVKQFLDRAIELSLVDDLAARHVEAVWHSCPWFYRPMPEEALPVRHNLDTPLLEQVLDVIGSAPVDELTVHAPYWDRNCEALKRLLDATSPAKATVLVQAGRTQVDPNSLSTVLDDAGVPYELLPVDGPDSTFPTALHAKFIIIRQDQKATVVQGSANLSKQALLETAASGNVEMVNLLTGAVEEFSDLVDLLTPGLPATMPSLNLQMPPDEGPPEEQVNQQPRIVRADWDATTLTVNVDRAIEVSACVIEVGPDTIRETEVEDHTLTATPSPAIADRLDRGSAIRLVAGPDEEPLLTPWTYPYRLRLLARILTQRTNPAQIRRIAEGKVGLEEDIEALLDQLSEALVIDRSAIWKIAGIPAPPQDDEPVSGAAPSLDEIDFDQILKHPRLAQYRAGLGTIGDEPTDLAIFLASLTGRLGELGRSLVGLDWETPTTESEEQQEREAELEELDEEEAADHQREREEAIAEAIRRQRHQFARFTKRFVEGIRDPLFAELVGPQVVVTNAIILVALIGRLIDNERIDHSVGAERLATVVEFMWGPGGYLQSQDPQHRQQCDDVLREHSATCLVVAAIHRIYELLRAEPDTRKLLSLRDLWRGIVTHFSEATDHATLAGAVETSPWAAQRGLPRLSEDLLQLATFTTESEVRQALADFLNVAKTSVADETVRVTRGGHTTQAPEIRIQGRPDNPSEGEDPFGLDEERIADLLSLWKRLDPRRGYYRLVLEATRGRVLLDETHGDAWWMASRYDEPHDIGDLPDRRPSWHLKLESVCSQATRTVDSSPG